MSNVAVEEYLNPKGVLLSPSLSGSLSMDLPHYLEGGA